MPFFDMDDATGIRIALIMAGLAVVSGAFAVTLRAGARQGGGENDLS